MAALMKSRKFKMAVLGVVALLANALLAGRLGLAPDMAEQISVGIVVLVGVLMGCHMVADASANFMSAKLRPIAATPGSLELYKSSKFKAAILGVLVAAGTVLLGEKAGMSEEVAAQTAEKIAIVLVEFLCTRSFTEMATNFLAGAKKAKK